MASQIARIAREVRYRHWLLHRYDSPLDVAYLGYPAGLVVSPSHFRDLCRDLRPFPG